MADADVFATAVPSTYVLVPRISASVDSLFFVLPLLESFGFHGMFGLAEFAVASGGFMFLSVNFGAIGGFS